MTEFRILEIARILEENNLKDLCDSLFQKVEEEFVDVDKFEETFIFLISQLPLEDDWYEKRHSQL